MRKFFLLTKLTQVLASALATLTIALSLGCVGGGLAIWAGAAPPFNWKFTPDGQHSLVFHNGPNGPACPTAPLSVDCAWRSPGRHEFDAHYITAHEVRLLISFEVPER